MRLRRFVELLSFGILPLCLAGCPAANRSLRSQPTSHFQVEDYPAKDDAKGVLGGMVTLHCTRIAVTERKPNGKSNGGCEYTTADVTKLIEKLPGNEPDSQLRDATLDLLLGISDYNCSNFLGRAFAVRSTFDLASTYIGDLSTAVSAGTVTAAPGLSIVFDGLNLLVGKANSNFDKEFYQQQEFHALESAIAAERTRRKTQILLNRGAPGYSLMAALADARYYDDACSIKVGVASLADIAKASAATEEDKNLALNSVTKAERPAAFLKMQKNIPQALFTPNETPKNPPPNP